MKLKPCEEKKKILASFGKTPLMRLKEKEWDVLLEHIERCKICKRNHDALEKPLKKLIRILAGELKIERPVLDEEIALGYLRELLKRKKIKVKKA